LVLHTTGLVHFFDPPSYY